MYMIQVDGNTRVHVYMANLPQGADYTQTAALVRQQLETPSRFVAARRELMVGTVWGATVAEVLQAVISVGRRYRVMYATSPGFSYNHAHFGSELSQFRPA
jgi:hypothetical protein